MPLIIIVGIPCSGKSFLAQQMHKYFTENGTCKTILISDSQFGPVSEVYKDSKTEKLIRNKLRSDVLRNLNKDTLVILDSSNYIKGFRYELYCLSKEHKTTHCVVECFSSAVEAFARNSSRPENERYPEVILQTIIDRYEAPDSKNRWDSPYFVFLKSSPLEFKPIEDALFARKPGPPNQSTQSQPLSEASILSQLDIKTKEIVDHITRMQRLSLGPIKIPGEKEEIKLNRVLTPSELNRIRRLFISYCKCHPINNVDEINDTFIQYLNTSLEN